MKKATDETGAKEYKVMKIGCFSSYEQNVNGEFVGIGTLQNLLNDGWRIEDTQKIDNVGAGELSFILYILSKSHGNE